MREIVYAATGKEIREILATEILDPLGFRWTNFGVAERDVPLVAPSHATGRQLPPVIAAVFRKAIGGTVHEIIPIRTPRSSSAPSSRRPTLCQRPTSCPALWKSCAAVANSTVFVY